MNKVQIIYGKDKASWQIKGQIMSCSKNDNILITKVSEKKFKELHFHSHIYANIPQFFSPNELNHSHWIYVQSCHAAIYKHPTDQNTYGICIVSAGISDEPVVDEIGLTLSAYNYSITIDTDIGVNNINKSLAEVKYLKKHHIHVIISVQGFEGALPVVLAGLTDLPIISVPTSTGYGLSQDGQVALDTSLTSCTSGIACVNINNGFGAAMLAMRIMKQIER